MTMSSDNKDRDPLDALFAQAREAAPLPDVDFMARLVAEAERLQPAPKAPAPAPRPARKTGLIARFAALLGGAAAVAGLGTAAMAGLVIGYVQPDSLVTLTDGFGLISTGESLDLLPSFDTLLTEE